MKSNSMIFILFLVLASAFLTGCATVELESPKIQAEAGMPGEPEFMNFVFVKGGCYMMGDISGGLSDDMKPVHNVCVSDFYLGKYEVTQRQWEKIMGDNPSNFKECGADCPVENVSWDMIQEFIKKLNASSGRQYRLPTEAEWEYAARSGGKKERWAGIDDETKLDEYAWYEKNSGNTTHKVGQKKSNGLRLHDMSGNIYEWCNDLYTENYYGESPGNNPQGAGSSMYRALRGGSWEDNDYSERTDGRGRDFPDGKGPNNGFRLALPAGNPR